MQIPHVHALREMTAEAHVTQEPVLEVDVHLRETVSVFLKQIAYVIRMRIASPESAEDPTIDAQILHLCRSAAQEPTTTSEQTFLDAAAPTTLTASRRCHAQQLLGLLPNIALEEEKFVLTLQTHQT